MLVTRWKFKLCALFLVCFFSKADSNGSMALNATESDEVVNGEDLGNEVSYDGLKAPYEVLLVCGMIGGTFLCMVTVGCLAVTKYISNSETKLNSKDNRLNEENEEATNGSTQSRKQSSYNSSQLSNYYENKNKLKNKSTKKKGYYYNYNSNSPLSGPLSGALSGEVPRAVSNDNCNVNHKQQSPTTPQSESMGNNQLQFGMNNVLSSESLKSDESHNGNNENKAKLALYHTFTNESNNSSNILDLQGPFAVISKSRVAASKHDNQPLDINPEMTPFDRDDRDDIDTDNENDNETDNDQLTSNSNANKIKYLASVLGKESNNKPRYSVDASQKL